MFRLDSTQDLSKSWTFVYSKSLLPNPPQSYNDSNASSLDREEDTSYIFNQTNDVSDSESIFKLIADYFAGGMQIIQKLLSTTVSTLNISVARSIDVESHR